MKIQTNSKVNDSTPAKGWAGCGARRMWAILLALALTLAAAAAGQAIKRLILTDGSYQAVTEWKREGDRIRYFSAERSQWEELPAALVDWKATDAWNAAAVKSQDKELKQVTGEEIAARKEEMLNTPQVAPKLAPELRLPAEGGVFLLEEQAGKPVLQQVQGSRIEENDHEAANRLKKAIIPLAGQTQTIELKGSEARVRVHSGAPSIFVDVENDLGPIAGDNFRIVRLERKHDRRVLATNKVGLTGQHTREVSLPARAEKFSGDWWKLTPQESLAPGEYAIVTEGLGEAQGDVVWDFGVDQ